MEMNDKERKRSTGRKRKIQIQKIVDKPRLQVTFSKRKNGLFNKANELSVLCGAEVALILFSPAGKAFACGHPTPDHIIDRFLDNAEASIGSSSQNRNVDELSLCQQRCMEVEKELDEEKKRGLVLQTLVNCNVGTGDDQFWWDTYVDGLSLNELEQMRSDMENLKKIVEKKVDETTSNSTASSSSPVPMPDTSMMVPYSDVNPVVGDDEMFDFSLDMNPIDAYDQFDFSNIGNANLLELEC
ncbi:hypothetical protein MKW94_004505 [Papaver nudicaule]|uniref:MADS-box domain-containing protein n=1 Tax=Papaver nudicaule TaxID=74823 RepID=A0AA41SJR9_PAPNU|nr:hypothetical protein [Papaver nudicaule]